MPSDAEILERVERAFAECPRPEHFTNYQHCCECAEHNETLRAKDVATLSMEDVGYPSWDPVCFLTAEGFLYYFPALARLALEEPGKLGWYGDQFLFHLLSDGRRNRRIMACSAEQRRSVVELLTYIVETRAVLADQYDRGHELVRAIEYWSEEIEEVDAE